MEQLSGENSRRRQQTPPPAPRTSAIADDAQNTRNALRVWREAADLRGTLGWRYLQLRSVDVGEMPNSIGDVLRWHPRCPWVGSSRPCLVALWTDTRSGEPRAIHRRPISEDGHKLDVWKALGPTTGSVIRLWPDDEVQHGLVVGEGIETVLGAATRIEHRGTRLRPAWAAGDAGHLAALPVLTGIDALTILVDHDTNNAGQRAAAACASRWSTAGREVIRLTPRGIGADFANIVEAA